MREKLHSHLKYCLLTVFYILLFSLTNQAYGSDIEANNEIRVMQTELVGGDFTYDGIKYFYDVTSKSARVRSYNNNLVRHNLIIPDEVVYKGITVPVTDINEGAFAGCTTITGTLKLGKNITFIDTKAFSGCTGLTGSLEIPNSVKKIYPDAFSDCTGFDGSLTIGNSVDFISERAFANCSGFTSLDLGNSVSYIGENAFLGCTGLTGTLILPDCGGLAYSGAFWQTRFTELIIPEAGWAFGNFTLYTLGTLKKIVCYATRPTTFKWGSPFNNYKIPLYVPKESINAYKTADVWKEFYDIRAIEGDVDIEEISFNESEIQLKPSDTFQLIANISPDYATNQSLNWASSDSHIATVDENGLVTALTPGITIITATTANGLSATCKVMVNPVLASTITLNASEMTMLVGQTDKLTATVSPENTTDKTITWTSDNEEIATVSENGTVTAVAAGLANITATCGDVSASCKVTINPVNAASVSLNVSDMILLIGQTDKLTATVSPDNVTDKTVVWTSDNESIATVSEDGTVTAISVGVANITATCGDVSASCKVTVNPIVASNINLNVEDMTLLIGATEKLTATVTSDNTTDKKVTWTSDKPEIATVSEDGTVTAIAVGVAKITATCGEARATCTVTVNPIVASNINLNVKDMTLLIGASEKLTATVTPDNTTDKKVTWTSDKPGIATVSEDGTVTGIAVGTTIITATCGEASATCTVSVNPIVASNINLNVEDMTLLIGASEKLTATVTPDNTTDKKVTWTSDKPEIATVSEDGTVTAIAVGVAKITATCGKVSATCTVSVNPIVASNINLNVTDMTLLIGASEKLTATVTPDNTTDKKVTWTSDKPEIATVSEDGTVTAIAVGTATITATCGEVSASCTVTVNPIVASTINLNVEDMTLLIGASEKLTATVTPDNTTDKKVTWTSDKPEIATVSEDGTVTAIAVGVAKITATCGKVSATCTVSVNPIVASNINLNVEDMTLLIGASEKLTATVTPDNTTDKKVTWTSDKPEIATVSEDGTVTAIAVGTATITATCGEVSATCSVTVNSPVIEPTAIILSAEDLWILKGRKESLTAQVLPADTTNPEIIWSTADPSIASVDENGIVTAISAGVTNIYATCGEITATCTVTVGERPDAPTKMERKGNGTSRTFVILMPLSDDELAEEGYNFVYGYTDTKGDDHVFASSPLRYSYTTSEIYNNPDNDFWVFAVVTNEDGEDEASVRCHLDGSEDDDFDAASLIEAGNSTRSKNCENWIIPTHHGARISIRSCGETSVAAYTLDGSRIFNENYGAGVDVDAHLTDEILPPSTYIIVAVSGDNISTKKIIIR